MAAYGLYTHIASNKLRSMLLLVGLFLLIYIIVFAGALIAEVVLHDGRSVPFYLQAGFRDLVVAMPFATVGTVIWIVIAYFFHQTIIDAVTGGTSVSRAEQPRLYNLLENLCISRGMPMPQLKVMDSDALNAFASGLNPRQYAITVTSGLLRSLNDQEVEAVLGHELTHIRNGDVQLMVVAVIIAGVVGFFGELLFRIFSNMNWSSSRSSSSSSSDRKGGGGIVIIIAIALIVVAWLLSQVVKMALSRSREMLADAGSVELTKNPDAMISALRKIEGRGELPGATSAVMELCVDNPREGFADLFATHPSIDSRVQALVQFAGGRDPGPIDLPGETPAHDAEAPDADASPAGGELPGDTGTTAGGITTSVPKTGKPAMSLPGLPGLPWGRKR